MHLVALHVRELGLGRSSKLHNVLKCVDVLTIAYSLNQSSSKIKDFLGTRRERGFLSYVFLTGRAEFYAH